MSTKGENNMTDTPDNTDVNPDFELSDAVFNITYNFLFDIQDFDTYQSKIRDALSKIYETRDDRAMAIMGGIVLENQVDALLTAFLPNFEVLDKRRILTLSSKILLIRTSKLIPETILNSADEIRKIRNVFAHDLDCADFESIGENYRKSLIDHVGKYNSTYRRDDPAFELYRDLVQFITVILYTYTCHIEKMTEFLRSEAFIASMRVAYAHNLPDNDEVYKTEEKEE
jgi:hypothetical protein